MGAAHIRQFTSALAGSSDLAKVSVGLGRSDYDFASTFSPDLHDNGMA